MKIVPHSDRVLIEYAEADEVTKGGILLPDTAKRNTQVGIVLAVGPGRFRKQGEMGESYSRDRLPMSAKPGDKVIFSKFGATEVEGDDGKRKILVGDDDVLATVFEEEG